MKLRVTNTQLDYEGSITIGRKLLNGLLDGEKVQVSNISTGKQFETYVIAGDKDTKTNVTAVLAKYISGTHCQVFHEYDDVFLADQILDLCEEGVCVNGAAARLVQIGDEIEVTNGEGG